MRRRLLLDGSEGWGGFLAFETARIGGPISIAVYRSDGARLWSIAVLVPDEREPVDRELIRTVHALTRWPLDQETPRDSLSLQVRTAAVISAWLARTPARTPSLFVTRLLHGTPLLAPPTWPDSTVRVTVWRSGPGTNWRPAQQDGRTYTAPVLPAKVPDCDNAWSPPLPTPAWQPWHSHHLHVHRMEARSAAAAPSALVAYRSLLASLKENHARIVRRVCELPAPARDALGASTGDDTGEQRIEVADFDQELEGQKLIVAVTAASGGWMCVLYSGFEGSYGGYRVLVYGSRGMRLQWRASVETARRFDSDPGQESDVVQQLLNCEGTPEGRAATVPLVRHVAKVIGASVRAASEPNEFLVAPDIR